jgi:hypothetical protein
MAYGVLTVSLAVFFISLVILSRHLFEEVKNDGIKDGSKF